MKAPGGSDDEGTMTERPDWQLLVVMAVLMFAAGVLLLWGPW